MMMVPLLPVDVLPTPIMLAAIPSNRFVVSVADTVFNAPEMVEPNPCIRAEEKKPRGIVTLESVTILEP